MIDLSSVAGIPIALKEDGELRFGAGLVRVPPHTRTLEDMRAVLYDESAEGPPELYYMYRAVSLAVDRIVFVGASMRYDVTVIMPGLIGDEYVKTMGHYHPQAPDSSFCYPEVYEVLYGTAHYLIQSSDADERLPVDVIIVEAGAGEKVLVPPGYGHVTINPSGVPLVMCNLVEREFESEYVSYLARKGAAYYELDHHDKPYLVPNPRYRKVGRPRYLTPREIPGATLVASGLPLYSAFMSNPSKFEFLVNPQLCSVRA